MSQLISKCIDHLSLNYKIPFIKLLSYVDFTVACPVSPNSVTCLYCIVFVLPTDSFGESLC